MTETEEFESPRGRSGAQKAGMTGRLLLVLLVLLRAEFRQEECQ